MSKTKDELIKEISLLKELLKDKDSIASEYKSYSDNFEKRLVEFEKTIDTVLETKLNAYKDSSNPRLDYFKMLFFMATSFAITWVFIHGVLRLYE